MLNFLRYKSLHIVSSIFASLLLVGSACHNTDNSDGTEVVGDSINNNGPKAKTPREMIESSDYRFDVLAEIEAPIFSPKKTFGIVITAFNRPEYLRKTLASLKASDLSNAAVVIVDDASTNIETIALIKDFDLGNVPLYKFTHRKNSGVLSGLLHGFKFLFKNTDYVLNIDSDVIMNRKWLDNLQKTHRQINDPNIILTGFNTSRHPVKTCSNDWCTKGSIGGINFFMSSDFYQAHFQKWFADQNRLEYLVWKMWDWTCIDKMKEKGFSIYATKPSVIQHIGFEGLNSDGAKGADIAEDFVED